MRFIGLLVFVTVLVAGCAGSSSPKPSPTPGFTQVARVGPAPRTTPPKGTPSSVKKGVHATLLPATVRPLPTATPIPQRAYTAVVYGAVTNAKTKKPVQGAVIAVNSGARTTSTNAHGQYRISFPGGVAVPMTVTRKGYAQVLVMGLMPRHHSYHKDFRMTPGHQGTPPPPGFFQGR